MSIAISAENLSKEYVISHQQKERYYALRDVITRNAKRISTKILHVFSSKGKKKDVTDSRHERFFALDNISFEVEKGERIGIIGRNGAGKSTLLKILGRVTEPTKGRVVLHGNVASLLEVGTGFHPELTGRENIFLSGAVLGMRKVVIQKKFDEIVAFAECEKFIDTAVKHFSSGMYVRLAFAVAAHLDPAIMLVDEVLAVGDLNFRRKCLGKIEKISTESNRTILFVSHDMSSIRQLCNRAILLSKGKIIKNGDAHEVTAYYEKISLEEFNKETPSMIRDPLLPSYHLSRIELRNVGGEPCRSFMAGDIMEIHFWSSGVAPADAFTIEFILMNERGHRISFGAANPVRNTYFNRTDRHFVCKLGPLPLTVGKYTFTFLVRVWNQPRWDMWENAISFEVTRCDMFGTEYDVPSGAGGDFVINQEWSAVNDK